MQLHDEWLAIAEDDLKAAKRLLHGEDPLVSQAVVLAQQSAEKALKGYLVYSAYIPAKTHNLIGLVNKCAHLDREFTELRDAAADLNPHISVSRYPDCRGILPDVTSAKILLERSEMILNFIKN